MAVIQDFYAFPVFNAVTPSSAGAIAAPTLGRPASGTAVNVFFPADATVEIYDDAEWLTQVDWK